LTDLGVVSGAHPHLFMPWNQSEPDPLGAKRRELAERERLLAEKMSRLTQELTGEEKAAPSVEKSSEPPVWRMEEEGFPARKPEPAIARKRNLAHQRQRDMMLFFIFVAVFMVVVAIFIWLYLTHYVPLNNATG
jgi:hypothetical protein